MDNDSLCTGVVTVVTTRGVSVLIATTLLYVLVPSAEEECYGKVHLVSGQEVDGKTYPRDGPIQP